MKTKNLNVYVSYQLSNFSNPPPSPFFPLVSSKNHIFSILTLNDCKKKTNPLPFEFFTHSFIFTSFIFILKIACNNKKPSFDIKKKKFQHSFAPRSRARYHNNHNHPSPSLPPKQKKIPSNHINSQRTDKLYKYTHILLFSAKKRSSFIAIVPSRKKREDGGISSTGGWAGWLGTLTH